MKTNSDTPKKLYVGLDVHKEKTVPALLGHRRTDEPEDFRVFQTTQHGLEKAMRAIIKAKDLSFDDLHVCYEASGCGFWIARRLLQMGITKCGNGHARWILIECATHYRYPPKISAALAKRQVGRGKWIRDLAWKTQQRLHKRHKSCALRQLHYNKTKVAVARELAAFIWELGTRIEAKSH